ncbi:MAG: 16S rRNA (guanine(966)-N(2))-methyltransferase RsmD [Clostridia bacterium]|nr:16S rRNA (guanine(966)-N(2))-methyltransferase RsmD [Clostridia bacterium]
MRVITGTAKGFNLKSIESLDTRPTLDRIKVTMFDLIPDTFYDKNILDIFSGSGALGIEALSRGASHCEFVEKNPECCKVIEENLNHTRLIDKANINNSEVLNQLTMFTNRQKFDMIFMDPPYDKDLVNMAIDKIYELDLLADDGLIIAECGEVEKINSDKFEILKERTFKKMSLYILGKK